MCHEVLAWGDYFPNRQENCREDITSMLAQLGNAVLEPADLGLPLVAT